MSAWEQHQALMRARQVPHEDASFTARDMDVLRRTFRFVRDDEDDARHAHEWERRMAVRYYAKLFREYAICDLRYFRDGRVGLRWRTEQEVVMGRGQFSCGAKGCAEREGLHSYEVNFAYEEAESDGRGGERRVRKRCLVKVRVCGTCALKLFYRKLRAARRAERLQRRPPLEADPARQTKRSPSPVVGDAAVQQQERKKRRVDGGTCAVGLDIAHGGDQARESLPNGAKIATNSFCAICLDFFGGAVQPWVNLPCGHVFCEACSTQMRSEPCALCRSTVRSRQPLHVVVRSNRAGASSASAGGRAQANIVGAESFGGGNAGGIRAGHADTGGDSGREHSGGLHSWIDRVRQHDPQGTATATHSGAVARSAGHGDTCRSQRANSGDEMVALQSLFP